MKILVCLGNVPDTTTKVKFTDNNQGFDKTGVQWIINPWDELALTRAMEIKEDSTNSVDKVVVITVGEIDSEPTIRKALAIGADEAIRINTKPVDSYYVAGQMAEEIRKHDFDIILCGIESADYNGASVGGMLSEFLGFTSVSAVSGLNIDGTGVILSREIDGGDQKLKANTPLIAIVQKGIAIDPRIPAMRGIMMARKKPLNVVEPVDIDSLTEDLHYELPQPKPPCQMIDPENVKDLVNKLQNEAKVL